MQILLSDRIKTTYNNSQYNYVKGNRQRIELHRGCPHGHDYCLEPKLNIDFPIPELVKNYVEILDMNLLARTDCLNIIKRLGSIKANNRIIKYEAVCGFDFRFLTQEIASELKKSRFIKIRLAWDGSIKDQYKIKDSLNLLLKAGYKRKEISFFMIVNWKISRSECERKLDILKVWNCKVCDCCYDGGYRYAVPMYWSSIDIKEFRSKCRKHNQLINFGIDPEI